VGDIVAEFQTLRDGRIQLKVDADDRRLLDELVLQERESRRRRRAPASIADVLIPLIVAWCRRPRPLTGVAIAGKARRVDCRVRFPHDRVCRQFVSMLESRGEKNASAVLRAIIREHIEPRRTQLRAAIREREADARRREIRERKAAKQQQYRARFEQDAVADAIELFLSEFGEHYKGRAVERLDRDAAALAKLGLRVADHFAAVMNAKERRNPRAVDEKRQFAEEFVLRLGYALPARSQRAF
jgi:hypothetical protein